MYLRAANKNGDDHGACSRGSKDQAGSDENIGPDGALHVGVAAEKALPFDVKVPNATTAKALRAADQGKGKRLKSAATVFKDLGI